MNDFNLIIVIQMLESDAKKTGNNLHGKLNFAGSDVHMTGACKIGFNSIELLTYLLSKLYAMKDIGFTVKLTM